VNPTEQFISANQNATINVTLSKQGAVSLGYVRLALLQPNGTEPMIMDVQGSSFTDDQARVEISMAGIGPKTIIVTVYDAQSAQVQRSTVIVMLRDAHEQAARVRAIIEGFRARLLANDIDGAVGYFTENERATYRTILTALGSDVAQLATALATPLNFAIYDDEAYVTLHLVVGSERSMHNINLVRDEYGLWRISSL
jgi:hypothetical protein